MSRAIIIQKISEEFSISESAASDYIQNIFDTILATLSSGKNINIAGFGKFILKNNRVSFSPSRKFSESVNYNFAGLETIKIRSYGEKEFENKINYLKRRQEKLEVELIGAGNEEITQFISIAPPLIITEETEPEKEEEIEDSLKPEEILIPSEQSEMDNVKVTLEDFEFEEDFDPEVENFTSEAIEKFLNDNFGEKLKEEIISLPLPVEELQEEKTEEKLGKLEEKLPEIAEQKLEKLQEISEEKIEEKIEEKLEKIEEKLEKLPEVPQEKIEEKTGEKLEKLEVIPVEKVEEKIEEKLEDKLPEVSEEKIEEKTEEKLTVLPVEKVEKKIEEKLPEIAGGKIEEKIPEKTKDVLIPETKETDAEDIAKMIAEREKMILEVEKTFNFTEDTFKDKDAEITYKSSEFLEKTKEVPEEIIKDITTEVPKTIIPPAEDSSDMMLSDYDDILEQRKKIIEEIEKSSSFLTEDIIGKMEEIKSETEKKIEEPPKEIIPEKQVIEPISPKPAGEAPITNYDDIFEEREKFIKDIEKSPGFIPETLITKEDDIKSHEAEENHGEKFEELLKSPVDITPVSPSQEKEIIEKNNEKILEERRKEIENKLNNPQFKVFDSLTDESIRQADIDDYLSGLDKIKENLKNTDVSTITEQPLPELPKVSEEIPPQAKENILPGEVKDLHFEIEKPFVSPDKSRSFNDVFIEDNSMILYDTKGSTNATEERYKNENLKSYDDIFFRFDAEKKADKPETSKGTDKKIIGLIWFVIIAAIITILVLIFS